MQYTREDWIKAGLDALAETGVDGVRVEAIARRLNISKGSFYHHFRDRQDLLTSMIDYWEEHATERIISAHGADRTLEQLLTFVFTTDKQREAAMYAWAKQNAALSQRMAVIEKRRIHYVTTLYQKKGLPSAEAGERAHLAYLLYVGWLVRSELDTPFPLEDPLELLLRWA
ncbi:TetR/AcrR family transcriptional regulator [Brevibacillus choshinensis]|uniref:TetR/AcrR family transcriptional regulator n=1 Tax=Brevibacillus choshinensis TaxID=54911 RepID=A0ABX7FK47_BRECH|nr:TetR/AcrR family transcriptional regulator [Brevibacillus choshinensis]QRG66014.1 TetR/AcrR family transcriptional regulator [Brevibacillus choshinensis]